MREYEEANGQVSINALLVHFIVRTGIRKFLRIFLFSVVAWLFCSDLNYITSRKS